MISKVAVSLFQPFPFPGKSLFQLFEDLPICYTVFHSTWLRRQAAGMGA